MSFSAQLLKTGSRWVSWLLVFLVLLIALLTVTVRQLLPALTDYHSDIEAYLSQRLNTEVSIGVIEASWQGRFPTLLLQDVKIADHHSRSIKEVSVGQLILGINPVSSLVQWQPVLSKVELWSLHTEVKLFEGQLAEKTAHSGKEAVESTDPLAVLWLQPHIFLYDTQLKITLPSGKQVLASSAQLNLENSDIQHHFRGELLLEYQQKTSALTVMVESEGEGLNPADSEIDFYVKLVGLDSEVLELGRELFPLPDNLNQIRLDTELWGHWQAGRLSMLQGALDLDELNIEQESMPLQVDDFTTGFVLLQPEPERYQLQLKQLSSVINQAPLVLPEVVIDYNSGQLESVAFESLNLAALDHWLQSQSAVPDAVKSVLQTINLDGVVNNLHVQWPHTEKPFDVSQVELKADLDRVQFAAAYGAPAMDDVTGRLELNYLNSELSGRIDLQSEGLGLFFPEVFKQGWQFEYGQGVIHFGLAENILTLRSEKLELQKPGTNASGRWSLYLPLEPEIQSELTLLIGLKGSDGSLAPELIPDHEIDPEIKRWVAAAVKKGHVNQGGFMLRTGTRTKADRGPPVVQLFLDIADANIQYQDGWPAVTDAKAQFLLRDQGIEVNVSNGRILESDVDYTWVYMPPGSDRLTVLARAEGNASDIQRTLLKSPLIAEGGELSNWQLAGDADTTLRLGIPLGGQQDVQVDLISTLQNGSLASDKRSLKLSAIDGEIGYRTGTGLYAKQLAGQFFGYPFKASIASKKLKSGERIRTTLDSKIGLDQIRQWSGIELLKLAKGVQSYRSILDICTSGDCSGLTIQSDLSSTSLDLVAPYSKEKGEKSRFDLSTDFKSPQTIELALGDQLSARLKLQQGQLRGGVLALGRDGSSVSDYDGLMIKGELDSLDYTQLSDFLDQSGLLERSGSAGVGEAGRQVAVAVDLKVGEFVYQDFSLTGVHGRLNQTDGWQLALSNVDSDIRINFPDNNSAPFQVEIGRLNLDRILASKIAGGQEGEPVDESIPQETPGSLSDFDISIASLILRDKQWGRWSFKVRNRDQQTLIQDIQGEMDQLSARGQLDWQPGRPSLSTLVLRLEAKNVGQSLAQAGFDKVLESKSFNADLKFSWPGAPWQYKLADTDGHTRFEAKDGRLIEAGATGFLRVFGILNMNAIGRRLRLDFADLFEKGVSFDQMSGDYQIRRGIATTQEPFILRGPSVDMAMTGKLDLVAETVDKQIAVTLPVTDNIPLAAVLLGAPQVAGVAFLLDKLIGDKVKKEIATVGYQMKGDWSDPQVELIQGKAAATE